MPILDDPVLSTSNPFADKTAPFYATSELTQRFNLIHHLIQNSEQLLLILAEEGYGKTTLLRQIQITASEHWWTYVLTAANSLSNDDIVIALLSAFNIRLSGKSQQVMWESLRSHIASARYNGQLPVLLIDDAHLLPLTTLKFIIELALHGEPLTRMRIVLFAEPHFIQILNMPEFATAQNHLVHTIDIPPLSEPQVRDYIQFRLQTSDYGGGVHPFSSEALKRIYIQSGGLPGNINPLAQEELDKFLDYTIQPRPSRPKRSYRWLWITLVVSLFIGGGAFAYHSYPAWFSAHLSSILGKKPLPLPADPVEEEARHQPTTIHLTGDKPSANATAGSKPIEATPPISPMKEVLGKSGIKDESWLRNQNSQTYTLQVLGAHDQETLRKFLARHSLESNQLALFKTERNNKDWYVLVYGIYPTREQAIAARDNLPASLKQETQPFPRSLDEVQGLIKKH